MFRNRTFAATVAAFALLTGSALAQDDQVELRFAHWVPPQHPLQVHGMTEWVESVEEASGGSINVTIYPGQQLGQAKDHYDMARDGISDISFINPGYQPGRFPIIGAGELPFLISNARGGSAALDAWYRQYAEQEMSDVKVCLVHFHSPGTFHSREPIKVPGDVDGMNVRPAHATMASFVSLLGGQNAQVSAPEARDALERGVADAITFPWNSILIFGIDKAVSHHLDIPLYATTFAWVMNKAKYEGMSENQKKVIDDHCTSEWAERVAAGWADNEDSGRQKIMEMDGHNIIEPSEEDVAAWREAAAPLREEWKKNVAGVVDDPQAALDGLVSELESRDSAY
ncbi:TRAP transporter substrate-binding protein [Nitratireductor mangrovi]|uniref:TRAP transporter substrate-binding protein n=1 Tax=Nitratireductor mangrovi TaxID=2599600 RepID=A0A5B8KYJ2_9HYPH|nr:TRAP transporter substrate-binding protein [Nitratireductor mangrovi]QDZ00550.1 TRAP transporter substrate-binding protein [Nitratireductor mangrovi]